MESEAQSLESRPRARLVPATFACWRKVLHKESVVLVDRLLNGNGDFSSIREALLYVSRTSRIPTSVVVTAGKYRVFWPETSLMRLDWNCMQLVGDPGQDSAKFEQLQELFGLRGGTGLYNDENVLPPVPPSSAPLKELSKICILGLCATLGQRAAGRVLYGTLCTAPCRLRSVQTILSDKAGNAVKLALYNLPSVVSSRWPDCFPEGMELAIKEPVLKQAADGSIMVRVDHPSNVVYVTPVCSACWRAACQIRKLSRCVRCRQARYCDRRCQLSHWKAGHKLECRPAPE